MASNSSEEALAEEVLNAVKNEPHKTLSKMKLIRATSFYEKLGDAMLEQSITDVARQCFNCALVTCTAYCKQYGQSDSNAEKASDLYTKFAECLGREHLHDSAVFHLDLALKVNPLNRTAAHNLVIQLWAVSEFEEAASLIHAVLRTPRTSVHEMFEQLHRWMLSGDRLPCQTNQVLRRHTSHNDDAQHDTVTQSAANIITTEEETQETDKGASYRDGKVNIPDVKRSKRSRTPSPSGSRSRSRSRPRARSWSEERGSFPTTEPQRLSRKELEKEANRRLKEMENIRAEILQRNAREVERRKERDSKKAQAHQSTPLPDLLHFLPGWGPRPVKKDTMVVKKTQPKEAKQVPMAPTNKSNDSEEEKKDCKDHVSKEERQEKRKPDISPAFEAKFHHHLACSNCFIVHGYGSQGRHYRQGSETDHVCQRNILLVARKLKSLSDWVKVRPRPNQQSLNSWRYFSGKFTLCLQYKEGMPCNRGEARCTFAHSEEERDIWMMDMNDKQFSLAELIKQQQKWVLEHDMMEMEKRNEATIRASLSMDPSPSCKIRHQTPNIPQNNLSGQELACPFQLEEICGTCWQTFGSIAKQKGNNCHTLGVQHQWECHRAFLLRPENELVRSFDPRRRNRCYHWDNRGICSKENSCTFIHGDAEYKVYHWMLEKNIKRLEDCVAVSKKKTFKSDQQVEKANKQLSQELTCPFQLEEICGTCWQYFGSMAKQKGKNCHTIGVHHQWESHRAFLLRPENELIRSFDPRRRNRCYHWDNRGTCSKGNSCTFIHGDAEYKVCSWMLEKKIHRLEDLVAIFRKTSLKSSQRAMDILKCEVKPVTDPLIRLPSTSKKRTTPIVMSHIGATTNPFCKVCNQYFSSQLEFDKHCTSINHEKNLLTDREKPWHYRPPPWGRNSPSLCTGVDDNSCRFTDVPDMYNQCPFAHSILELDEWRERTRHWKFKKSMMKDTERSSYVHGIQNEFANIQCESEMMLDKVENVTMEVTPDVTIYSTDKNCEQSWTITLLCKNEDLKKVCLLHDESRLHFGLTSDNKPDRPAQVEEGATFLEESTAGQAQYKVKVQFSAGLFGSFRQKVIFDFGKRPLLAVSLDVEVGNEFVQDNIVKLRNEHNIERWTSKTHRVIPFPNRPSSEKDEEDTLLCKYKPPDVTVFSQDSLFGDLSHNNYVPMMHRLVEMEELGQTQAASKFNVVTEVELTDTLPGPRGLKAPAGHLFGCVPLGDQRLTEDSDTGFLMLNGSVTAWVRLASSNLTDVTAPAVYEALIVCETNFGYDGRGKDHVYICLSKSCCTKLSLMKGQHPSLEVQLQIDRLPFCRMHAGLDQLPDTNTVFPDLSKYSHAMATSTGPKIRSEYFNPTQLEIVQHMMTIRKQYTPPLVVYGPFGSGKTETLARATEQVVTHRPESRVLICALNDSAADVYITRYFSKLNSINQQQILRVYPPNRRVATVSNELQPYCQKENGRFKLPDMATVEEHRVIVTTLSTSLLLTDQAMRGHFTHILLDEAGQCLECEAIMPLTLATPTTCVVITGDHRQLGPKSFTAKLHPKRSKLQFSILQRLQLYYKNFCVGNTATSSGMGNFCPSIPQDSLCKMLNVNYRSHPRIMQFVSDHFYGGSIHCKSQWKNDFQPIAFHATCGIEAMDDGSTSYHNISEVQEICEQIKRLYETWPESWGEKCPQKIAVLTPYTQQVTKIKQSLAKMTDCFKDIRVTTASDVQGEEFHAVFLSTVRTHHGVDSSSDGETFGFFSDINLLTTALTRAKCHVAVVGDPVSLNSCGRCINIWRSYLDCCNEDDTLYPKSLSLGEIRRQVGLVQDKLKSIGPTRLSHLLDQDIFDIGEIEADDIIQQLKLKSELDFVENQKEENSPMNTVLEIIEDDEHTVFKVSACKKEKQDKVVYKRKTTWKHMKLAESDSNGDDNDDEYDDDSNDQGKIYQDYNEEELLEFLKQDSHRYKRCIIRFEGSDRISARNLDSTDESPIIAISSRIRCNRAFEGDEVVVEVIRPNTPNGEAAQGTVVGVLKRARDLKYCVCRVNPLNLTSFIPLEKGMPRINNLIQERNKHKGSKVTAVTVYSVTKGLIHCIKEEKIDDTNPWSKLFVVKFLKWDAKFFAPLGIVVKVIETPTDIFEWEAVLQYRYNLHEKCKLRTEKEVKTVYPASYTWLESDTMERLDLTHHLAFTIDNQGSKQLDDALSVEEDKDGLLIGIHIADVSSFLQPDSDLDEEARTTGFCYSGSMLPERLSTELCSLRPESEQLALSILLTLDHENYNNVKGTEIKRTLIFNKHQLTYAGAQQILDDGDEQNLPKKLTESVVSVNKVAKVWRANRLGNSSITKDPKHRKNTAAHHLVEEMMIRANHEIGRFLMTKCIDIVPLRIQPFPNKALLNEWYLRYQNTIPLPPGLENFLLAFYKSCQCEGPCMCTNDKIVITRQTLQHMQDALERKDDHALQHLATATASSPQTTLADFDFLDIQQRAEYKCSGDLIGKPTIHASLNVEPYTHFTSPLRRYMDIVSHREVTAVLLKTIQPYTIDEIRETCDHFNRVSSKQRMYEDELQALKLNWFLKDHQLVLYPVVAQVEEDGINLHFPTVGHIKDSTGKILYSELNLESLPIFDEQADQVVLRWDEQVYNYAKWEMAKQLQTDTSALQSQDFIKLDPNRFVVEVQASLWQGLLKCVKEANSAELHEKTKEILNSTTTISDRASQRTATLKPLICEENLKLELTVFKSQVHRVQLASKVYKGELTPCIQLLILKDCLDICIEHRQDPIECFANLTGLKVTRTFKNVKQYLKRWEPLLKAEAATNAVLSGDNYWLKDVVINWTKEDEQYIGTLKLTTEFCTENQVFAVDMNRPTDEEYICVRYGGIKLPQKIKDDEMVQAAMVEDEVCFVAHCLVKGAEKIKQSTVIKVVLHQRSSPFPEWLLRENPPATLQVINMPLPIRRMMTALQILEGKDMARHLALGHRPVKLDDRIRRTAHRLAQGAPGLDALVKANDVQQRAVIKAMTNSFSLIHGPPGTGKTVTGARIAYLFTKQNEQDATIHPDGHQQKVLYCGPSNKSVEVVIDTLKKIKRKDHLELVRMYSEDVVTIKFPLPTKLKPPRRLQSEAEQMNISRELHHEQFALHLLIRDPSKCPEYSQRIRDFDVIFKQETEKMRREPYIRTEEQKAFWNKEVSEYHKLVFKASKHVLKKAHIVLVTCIGAASAKVANVLGDEIKQVIIDEAGMCTEPEVMVPLTACEPKQVVLIGDHMQLEPIVKSDIAKRLGMKQSLFERYVREGDMLTTQYRMHEAIAKFPSEEFYENKLEIGATQQAFPSVYRGLWPGGTQCPITFVSIKGEELTQAIATADGGFKSKYNPTEAKYTAKVVKELLKTRRIPQYDIQVLSQYRAQCKEIREHLGVHKVDVTTVVKSQGSEVDYVVFSTVRTLPRDLIEIPPPQGWIGEHLGFTADPHQVNVAITRARKGLIIIGNDHLLCTCRVWKQLLTHYRKHGAVTTSDEFKKRIENV